MRNLVSKLLQTAPLVHRDPTPGGVVKRAKYCLRGLAFAPYTSEWFEFLETPKLTFIVQNNPCLFHKLQRPYLNRVLNTAGRLDTLKQHYLFILDQFSQSLTEEVYAPSGKSLLELPIDGIGTLELRMVCSQMQKEGDLTLRLANKETGIGVATMSFSISKWQKHNKEIFIGGLQGNKHTDERTVVAITRALFGLRPKALLFYLVQRLGTHWGVGRLRAVSDDLHIYRHFQARRNVVASYNQFWEECGGILAPDGVFDLPATFVPREISSIRANKRQLYRRRYAMLDGMNHQLIARISGNKYSPVETASNALAAA
ncbi:MAG TPA: DUF535 family protein [Candidatus Acidoferrales bacterium]|jgi:uncharacterized protein VirK/YbjX|nr:DUF535 family protein [Candidatus Acidoferrales bacterium]